LIFFRNFDLKFVLDSQELPLLCYRGNRFKISPLNLQLNRMTAMNRSNRIKNKNSRRFSFSNILAKEVLLERMEDRIVPAYVSGDFGWAASFETVNINIGDGTRSSVVDSSGCVYQVGSFTGTVDFDPGTGTSYMVASGGQDAFVEKLDSTGKLLWVKTFSGTTNEKATSITLDASGNPVITGWYQGTVDFDPAVGGKGSGSVFYLTSQGAEDAFIVKLDSSGTFQWAKTVGGANSDQGFTITTNSANKILVGGLFYGTADFDPSASSTH